MSTLRLVIALLIVCGLVIFVLQNISPSIGLVIVGVRTAALPLAFWLGGAIALGALTTLLFSNSLDLGKIASGRSSNRRRWQVRPKSPSDQAGAARFRSPFSRGAQAARKEAPHGNDASRSRRPQTAPRDATAAEDWQTWGERTPASQWEDWSPANRAAATEQRFSRRQRQDREQATGVINDMDKGWDDSARDTVYVPPGGSAVEDALDEIAEGWDDWEAENTPAATAYSHGYSGSGADSRVDSVYGPPDDALEEYRDRPSGSTEGDRDEDWGLDDATDPQQSAASSPDTEEGEGVYDAEYRVIIPPYRPLDEAEKEGDRTP
ncbi:MAG: hypothetical protein AAFY20_03185 [Cyanobacteria bacterium J06639_14]